MLTPSARCKSSNIVCTIAFVKEIHMATLTYNGQTNQLTLTLSDGTTETWTAHNNAQTSSAGRMPNGTHNFVWHSPHSGAGANSAYGSHGNFIFDVPGRTGMGVHSGRATSTDGAGRTGTAYATNGCIRTTDAATERIQNVRATDPITSLTVLNN